MNRYQKAKSREVKDMMRSNRYLEDMTYKQVARAWGRLKQIMWYTPCEDCTNGLCQGPYNKIAYCGGRR